MILQIQKNVEYEVILFKNLKSKNSLTKSNGLLNPPPAPPEVVTEAILEEKLLKTNTSFVSRIRFSGNILIFYSFYQSSFLKILGNLIPATKYLPSL